MVCVCCNKKHNENNITRHDGKDFYRGKKICKFCSNELKKYV